MSAIESCEYEAYTCFDLTPGVERLVKIWLLKFNSISCGRRLPPQDQCHLLAFA